MCSDRPKSVQVERVCLSFWYGLCDCASISCVLTRLSMFFCLKNSQRNSVHSSEMAAELCEFESYSHAHHTITHFTTDRVHNTLHLCVICVGICYGKVFETSHMTNQPMYSVRCTCTHIQCNAYAHKYTYKWAARTHQLHH